MERQNKTIGQILVELGRITQDDVDRALERQRERGGYFGDSLVALGSITRDELRWTLADQFNLPFVQLRPDAIDPAVAALVPAAWAREHLVLPVLRAGDTVTAVLESPGAVEVLDELRRFTGAAAVEPALATPETIRELIEAVHGPGTPAPLDLARLFSEAVEAGADAVGISLRPGRVTGWYRRDRTVHRRLGPAWAADLEALVSPMSALPLSPVHAVRSWPAVLTLPEGSWRLECHAMGRGDVLEWTAAIGRPVPPVFADAAVEPWAAEAVRAALAEGGAAVVHAQPGDDDAAVTASELVESTLAGLPGALCGAEVRSLHLADHPVAVAPGLLYLLVREPLDQALARVAPFALQALTLDVAHLSAGELEAARRVAPLVAFHARDGSADGLRADIRLRLRTGGDGLTWSS